MRYLILCFLFLQCTAETKPQQETVHNYKQSFMEWAGTYIGTVPCADCPGIETSLTLNRNYTFSLAQTSLGKETPPVLQSGAFSWNDAGNVITLANVTSGPTQYTFGQNSIRPLDAEGNPLTDEKQVLRRTIESILAQPRWILVELMGKFQDASTAQIRFDAGVRTIDGYGWCNTFTGTYVLEAGNKISFAEMLGGNKICPDTTIEKQFINMFLAVDSYVLKGSELSLSRGGSTPLAKFEASRGREAYRK